MPGDASLGSKEKIAEAMVKRAIDEGKSQEFIKDAMNWLKTLFLSMLFT